VLLLSVLPDIVTSFSIRTNHLQKNLNQGIVSISAKKGGSGEGYKFGDLTRGLAKRLTGKDEYKFGDISRHLDKQSKAKVSEWTGKDDYEFGDLSKWVDSKVKEKVNDYTGKEEYELGDLSKEITKKALSKDYNLGDLVLLCKTLASFGVAFSPVAGVLPVKVLVEMLNLSIASELGERLVGALTLELDRRMKEVVTGNPDYQLGDLTKAGILSFIGKEEYSFGDITKTVLNKLDEKDTAALKKGSEAVLSGIDLKDEKIMTELEEWDNALQVGKKKSS